MATAERASAPVLPVVLWQDGHHTRVVAGPPLPRHPPEPPAGPRAEHPAERLARDLAMDPAERLARDLAPDPAESAARDRVEAGHEALARLVERARKPAWPAGPRSARAAARHLDRVFEALLSRTDPLPDHVLYEQAALLIALGRLGDRHNLDLRVGRLRLTALRHENHPLPVKAAALWRLRAGTEEALRRDPDHLMANYLLGRWHLSAPRLLGGRRDTAVVHLERAERLGRGDTRYVLGHAEALLAADRPADALSALERVIEAPADQPRTQRRRQSAIRMSRALRHGHAPGRPARPAGPRARVKG
ncbi:tetratricopeptide repeat protein [Streptomyces lienomycini]|uniref:tetratricopeptide repeat protein n=1 Tax=Streptomyces lienomycini TaxID=284035 RepID=UPI0022FE7AC0|nr:hypothetical protein [Streptomyces lienomycini]